MIIWLKKARPVFISLVGYLLFTLSVFLLFLYLMFPFRQVERRIISLLEEKASIKLEIKEDQFRPPVKYLWKGIKFNIQNTPYLDGIELDMISAQLNLLPLLKKRIEAELKVDGAGGSLNGRLIIEKDKRGTSYSIKGSGGNIDLNRVIRTTDEKKNNIAGKLKLDIDYLWSGNDPAGGNGAIDLEVNGLNVKNIEVNGFPIKDLTFSSVSGKVGLKGEVINIEKLTARTTDIELVGGGNIIRRNRFMESMLNLTFNINKMAEGPIAAILAPFSASNKGRPIILAIKGSIEHPIYYLNDIQLNR